MLTGDPSHITNGAADVQTETDTSYYRGMDGDQLPSGTRSVTVTDSLGEHNTDSYALAGMPLEVRVLNGAAAPRSATRSLSSKSLRSPAPRR